MLINLLVRTSYRNELFKRCMDSISSQTHKNIRIIVSYDDERALEYIPEHLEKIRVYKDETIPFYYDNYCNDLKDKVTSGYFLFLDDDDELYSEKSLEMACKQLRGNRGIICQFSRGGVLKPSNELIKQNRIKRGKIGMPCIILHHSCKNIAEFDGSVGASDYTWIRNVSKKVKLKFVSMVIVVADRRSHGALEL